MRRNQPSLMPRETATYEWHGTGQRAAASVRRWRAMSLALVAVPRLACKSEIWTAQGSPGNERWEHRAMSETLANLLNETRQFPPPPGLATSANVKADAYEEAKADRLGFWETQARRLSWAKEWDQALDWSNPPFAKWFVGGQLNVAYNCLDAQIEAGRGSKAALYWVGEPGD